MIMLSVLEMPINVLLIVGTVVLTIFIASGSMLYLAHASHIVPLSCHNLNTPDV